ncbi:hypothetical protein Bca4012_027748 [Brassica carinata]
MKGYFAYPHPNWKLTPIHVRRTWFKIYAQKYNWSLGVTEKVREGFHEKVKARLLDTVSNWKGDWIVKGYVKGKPAELTTEVWDGLIAYWKDPNSIKVAQACSNSRNSVDENGHKAMLHSTGQKPHAAIRLEMVRN